jgi:TonB family protein
MTSERAQDWVNAIAHGLIRRAARRAPDSLSERLEEEWLADLSERRGPLARLRFGVGCCWATNVIVRENALAAVPATSPPAASGTLAGFAPVDSSYFSARTATFLLIVCLHAALFYGLATGLGSKFTKPAPKSFVSHVIEATPRRDLPTPPPQLHFSSTRVEAPTPEAMPRIEANQPDTALEAAPDEPRFPLPHSEPSVANRVVGGPGMGFPSTNDFYPDAAIRYGEKGSATVNACIDGRGRLISEPTIAQSAGSTRLDDAAIKLAKAGSGHYRATTEDGRPVDSCYSFRIRFELKN